MIQNGGYYAKVALQMGCIVILECIHTEMSSRSQRSGDTPLPLLILQLALQALRLDTHTHRYRYRPKYSRL